MNTMALLDRKAAALAAAVLLAACAVPTLPAQNSPVGPWDIVLSGTQRGVMQLTFVSDFTLVGNEIITVRPKGNHPPDEADARTPGGDGRGFDDNGSSGTNRYVYGGADLEGVWTYDVKGKVIGIINELGQDSTNGIPFVATVRPGLRITLTANRNGRRVTGKGVPLVTLASFSGDYYGTGTRAGKPFTDLYTVTPGVGPNTYDVVGIGPSYGFAGSLIVSGQRQAALYTVTSETTNGLVRSVTGPFNLTRGSGNLLGVAQDPGGSSVPNNVRTSIVRQ